MTYILGWESEIIGTPVSKLDKLLSPHGLIYRVVKRDGKVLPTTKDLRADRINVEVQNGKVVNYKIEGGVRFRASGLKIDGTHIYYL